MSPPSSPDRPPEPGGGTSTTEAYFFSRRDSEINEAPVGVTEGQMLGGFRLLELIGQGGMGQVWRAEQASVDRQVALKLVRPELVTEKALDLFAREARAGARFRHPGIVDVIDHGTDDGIAWIAMEFVEGAWTLRDFLNDLAQGDELPDRYYVDSALFVAQVADAMMAVHDQGVIHRDLKPQNILIAPDDTPKVTDFGIARIMNEAALSVSGEVSGTYVYMSPEQVKARRNAIDHRTDIFSLGIVLYEMLAGRRPFEGDTSHQVTSQILEKDPPSMRLMRSRIPADLMVITAKCLEKEPSRRYPSMAELAADLRRHLNQQPIAAKPPGRLRKAWLWARRNPTKSVSTAVAALAFVVISLLFVQNVRTNRQLVETVDQRDSAIGLLESTNAELTQQTQAAEAAARAEKARADEVFRLSVLPDYDDLLAEADALWPAHPENMGRFDDWIVKAQKLVDELPKHRAKLQELSKMAIPQTEQERAEERAAHPSLPRLELIEGQILSRSRALARRKGGPDFPLPELTEEQLQLDAVAANALAWPLVDPSREARGQEPLGLALAQRALQLAEEGGDLALQAQIGGTVAWGLVELGRDEEGRSASATTLVRAPEVAKDEFRGYVQALTGESFGRASQDGIDLAAALIAELEAERVILSAEVEKRQSWKYPDTEDGSSARWWRATLAKLVEALEGLVDPKTGLLSPDPEAMSPEHGWSLPRRVAFAKSLQESQAAGTEQARRWRDAIQAIRSSEAYAGFELTPQLGLVPIGPDPQSGLWEFWHMATGNEPQRDPSGQLVRSEYAGVVLVLIPGGTFAMGSRVNPEQNANSDPSAEHNEGPVHEVRLSPYFLSKYELTQWQWLQLSGPNPSRHVNATQDGPGLLRPVEQVSWNEAKEVLLRMDLELPTEAQWEFGCRAGTSTPWWTGWDRESLGAVMAANVADQAAARSGESWVPVIEWPELDDGHAAHAPVGTYAANPFGLHEVHGNVWEWCLDGFEVSFYGKSGYDDPLAAFSGRSGRVVRGGSFAVSTTEARSANRNRLGPNERSGDVGVRPARRVR